MVGKFVAMGLMLGVMTSACARTHLLRPEALGDEAFPKPGANEMRDTQFVIIVNRVSSGQWWTNIYADITVENVGGDALFDPGEIELLVPETGITYFHITKDKSSVTVPANKNVVAPITLRPGQKIAGTLYFSTPQYQAAAKTLELRFRGQKLSLAP